MYLKTSDFDPAILESANSFGCIGSRDLTKAERNLCVLIGYFIAMRKKRLNSGNADHADHSYARGANFLDPSLVYLYMPNKDYNTHYIVEGNSVILEHSPQWSELARQHHYKYDTFPQATKNLFDRNAGIVLASDVIIALPSATKSWGGGTGHGMKIAFALGKPVWNLRNEKILTSLVPYIETQVAHERERS